MNSFGLFADCLVDGDSQALREERKVRRFGLAISLALQIAVVVTLVLVPILNPAVLPKLMAIVQVPVYRPPAIVPIVRSPEDHSGATTELYAPNSVSRPTANARPQTVAPDAAINLGQTADAGASSSLRGLGLATSIPGPPPVPREASHHPLQVSSGIMDAMLINRVQPRYPTIAQTVRVSGSVVLSAVIATDGSVQSLRIVSGNPLLISAAYQAVRQWRYRPTLLNGQPVEVQTLITVNFVLQ
jgi:protein TonB